MFSSSVITFSVNTQVQPWIKQSSVSVVQKWKPVIHSFYIKTYIIECFHSLLSTSCPYYLLPPGVLWGIGTNKNKLRKYSDKVSKSIKAQEKSKNFHITNNKKKKTLNLATSALAR